MIKLFESIFKEAGYDTFTNSLGEKDTYWNPYKAEPKEYDYSMDDRFAMTSSVKGDEPSSKEHLEGKELAKELLKAFREFDYHSNNQYKFNIEHRLNHDYEAIRNYKKKVATITRNWHALCDRAVEIGFDPYEYKDDVFGGSVQFIIEGMNHSKYMTKKRATNENRKATRDSNIKKRALETDIQELKDLLDENGDLKERRSYGTIKKYKDTPDGKNFLALWKKQFAN